MFFAIRWNKIFTYGVISIVTEKFFEGYEVSPGVGQVSPKGLHISNTPNHPSLSKGSTNETKPPMIYPHNGR